LTLDIKIIFIIKNMGEAKRREELGLPPRNINEDKRRKELGLPPKKIDKEKIKNRVKSIFKKFPFIPLIFYIAALGVSILGIFKIINLYK